MSNNTARQDDDTDGDDRDVTGVVNTGSGSITISGCAIGKGATVVSKK